MPANTSPIFARQADVQLTPTSPIGAVAVTAQDGSGALTLCFQADEIEGSFLREVKLKPVGATTAATVARLFLCTSVTVPFVSGTTNTNVNTNMFAEISLAATTLSQTAAQNDISIPVMQAIPKGMKVLIGFGTSTGAAGTGYAITSWGGDY